MIPLNTSSLAFIFILSLTKVHSLEACFYVQFFFSCVKNSGINFVDCGHPRCYWQTIGTPWEYEYMWLDFLIALGAQFLALQPRVWMERFRPQDELSVLHELGFVSEDPSSDGGGSHVRRWLWIQRCALCVPDPWFWYWIRFLKSKAGLDMAVIHFVLLCSQPELDVRSRIFT